MRDGADPRATTAVGGSIPIHKGKRPELEPLQKSGPAEETLQGAFHVGSAVQIFLEQALRYTATDADGRRLEWDGVDVFPFRDGLILRKDVYSSAHRARVLEG